MIIDCHGHVFQRWADLCGHESQEVHRKYIQKNVTRPSAKVRRARDGVPADAKDLFLGGTIPGLDSGTTSSSGWDRTDAWSTL